MKYELTVYDLGKVLKILEDKYKLNLLIKKELSGGWMTINGEVSIEEIPCIGGSCGAKNTNILKIRLISDKEDGFLVKLTGAKGKKFNVDIASSRYREIPKSSIMINKVKIDESECKLRIDEDIIFSINSSSDEIEEIINKELNA